MSLKKLWHCKIEKGIVSYYHVIQGLHAKRKLCFMGANFGTAINCMDGRIQFPVIDYVKRNFGVDFVDVITDPAPNKILSEVKDANRVERIKQCLELSVMKHGSMLCVLSAHHDCAGNLHEKETQIKQLKSAIKLIKSWKFGVKIIGLWIDEEWKANEIEQ